MRALLHFHTNRQGGVQNPDRKTASIKIDGTLIHPPYGLDLSSNTENRVAADRKDHAGIVTPSCGLSFPSFGRRVTFSELLRQVSSFWLRQVSSFWLRPGFSTFLGAGFLALAAAGFLALAATGFLVLAAAGFLVLAAAGFVVLAATGFLVLAATGFLVLAAAGFLALATASTGAGNSGCGGFGVRWWPCCSGWMRAASSSVRSSVYARFRRSSSRYSGIVLVVMAVVWQNYPRPRCPILATR